MIKFYDNYSLYIVEIFDVIEIKNNDIEFFHDCNKIEIFDNFQKKNFFEMTDSFSSFNDKVKIFFVNDLKSRKLKLHCRINMIFLIDEID